MVVKIKTIKISEETHERLRALGVKGQTFDELISILIDNQNAINKKSLAQSVRLR